MAIIFALHVVFVCLAVVFLFSLKLKFVRIYKTIIVNIISTIPLDSLMGAQRKFQNFEVGALSSKVLSVA